MREVDKAAIASGVPSFTLMQRAGDMVAEIILARFEKQPVLVLAGSGNNGGDGYIIAQRLLSDGWEVRLCALEKPRSEDAKLAAESFKGKVAVAQPEALDADALVVDALLGTGLSKPVEGLMRQLIEAINASGKTVVSVDLPSGISGDTGEVLGAAVKADLTISFVRKKLGHVLLPGREYCGQVQVIDIGIEDKFVDAVPERVFENHPALWASSLQLPEMHQHKYDRGHALVLGGGIAHTGAARMAAYAALRAGAGLVTVVCNRESLPIYAASLSAVMTLPCENERALDDALADVRITAVLAGPGNGVNDATRKAVLAMLKHKKPAVLDADALSVFSDAPEVLFKAVAGPCVLTPHEGEFERLFKNSNVDFSAPKQLRATQAAKIAGAVVVLKGSDTVIASPGGNSVINTNAPPFLATAGSGDVLAGMIAGLMAQGMHEFEAACAAVWMHGMAGSAFGMGLIAEDLIEMIPQALYAAHNPNA